jgi:hypothetical protein
MNVRWCLHAFLCQNNSLRIKKGTSEQGTDKLSKSKNTYIENAFGIVLNVRIS